MTSKAAKVNIVFQKSKFLYDDSLRSVDPKPYCSWQEYFYPLNIVWSKMYK